MLLWATLCLKRTQLNNYIYNSPGGVLTAKNDKDNVIQALIFYDSSMPHKNDKLF